MKPHHFVAASIAAALAAPAFAQDRSAPAAEEAQAKIVQKKSKDRPHSHLQDRQGIVAAQLPPDQARPAKKPLHDHAKFHKQQ